MRIFKNLVFQPYIAFVVLLLVPQIAFAAWSPEDQEIFRINHEVQSDLGGNVTFYSWLELPKGSKSSTEEIHKAYRKLSRKIHPDKLNRKRNTIKPKKLKKLKKLATERYQRLSIVGEILRSNKKKRYDYYLDKGFPKYKNNNWLYEKFRPGLALVAFVLFITISLAQYLLSKLQNSKNKERINTTITELKKQAWNGTLIPPIDGQDRTLRNEMLGRSFTVKIDGTIEMVDDQKPDEIHLISMNGIKDPTIFDTILVKFPVAVWNLSVGKVINSWKLANHDVEHFFNSFATKEQEKKNKKTKGNKKPSQGNTSGLKKTTASTTNDDNKMTLPNGKVIYKRKKNN